MNLHINAVEALRLRLYRKSNANQTVSDIASAYCAVPLNGCSEALQDLLLTIFEAGRIQGIRKQRKKNKPYS